MSPTSFSLAVLLLATPALAHAQAATMVRVTQTAAIVEQPDGGSAAVGTANPGEILEVLDERSGWLLVRPPAGSSQTWKTGWINTGSTQPISSGAPAAAAAQPDPAAPAAGARKGFIIGLGGGIGMHRATEPTFVIRGIRFGGETTNSVGVATEFDIGYAPTDQLLIYYANSVQFSNNETYDIVGLTGVGVTYALKPRAPSWWSRAPSAAPPERRWISTTARLARSSAGSPTRSEAVRVRAPLVPWRRRDVPQAGWPTRTVLRGTITWIFY